jgi:hypothetical protein
MKKPIVHAVVLSVFAVIFVVTGFGQQKESKTKKAFRITGKVTVAVVRSTARITYETAKLAGEFVVVPAAKNIVVPLAKAVPPAAKAGATLAGKGIKNGAKGIAKLIRRDPDDVSTNQSVPPGAPPDPVEDN